MPRNIEGFGFAAYKENAGFGFSAQGKMNFILVLKGSLPGIDWFFWFFYCFLPR
jgi:hypothetical protein